jgi:two-component system, NarL family, nitrate/nitrite response regulator NarL
VLDMRMPGLRGIDVVEALARDGSATRVLVPSAAQASAVVYAALAAGTAGYWSKDAERGAIAAVARGEKVLARGDEAEDLALARGQDGAVAVHLPRMDLGEDARLQRRVSMTAPAIAAQPFLSTATVNAHLAHLYDKLGVGDRSAAVAEAMRRGLLE